jgi:hypothetical protein
MVRAPLGETRLAIELSAASCTHTSEASTATPAPSVVAGYRLLFKGQI